MSVPNPAPVPMNCLHIAGLPSHEEVNTTLRLARQRVGTLLEHLETSELSRDALQGVWCNAAIVSAEIDDLLRSIHATDTSGQTPRDRRL